MKVSSLDARLIPAVSRDELLENCSRIVDNNAPNVYRIPGNVEGMRGIFPCIMEVVGLTRKRLEITIWKMYIK